MAFLVSGSPTQAFVDAVKDALEDDATLLTMIAGVYGHLSEAARTNYPYLVLGPRQMDGNGLNVGAMGLAGGRVSVELNGWSDHKGASEMHAILSRTRAVLERRTLIVDGWTMMSGSLTCEAEDVFDEPDEDKPGSRLYRGIQRWAAVIDERV